jgi:anti-sigma factor RsiW
MLCDRTREWVALRLDTDLSEFETALMSAHLERCEACRGFAGEVAAITQALRTAPLEPLAQPVELPTRRHVLRGRRVQLVAAAALVVLAAGLGSLYGAVRGPAAPAVAPIVHAPMVSDDSMLLRKIRLAELRPTGPLPLGATKPPLTISV